MKLNITNFLLGIILFLLVLLGIDKYKSFLRKPIIIDHYNYITDTVLAKKYYKLQELYKKKTPPKEVIRWLKPEPLKGTIIEKTPDSIILLLGELKEKLSISNNYIKNFPKADKLINFNLDKNNIDLTTINIKGYVKTKKYPLYLNNHKYQWYNNEMHNSSFFVEKIKKSIDFSQLYINPGYDYFNKYMTLGLDYSIIFHRFKLQFSGDAVLNPNLNSQFRTDIKLGYRLLK